MIIEAAIIILGLIAIMSVGVVCWRNADTRSVADIIREEKLKALDQFLMEKGVVSLVALDQRVSRLEKGRDEGGDDA